MKFRSIPANRSTNNKPYKHQHSEKSFTTEPLQVLCCELRWTPLSRASYKLHARKLKLTLQALGKSSHHHITFQSIFSSTENAMMMIRLEITNESSLHLSLQTFKLDSQESFDQEERISQISAGKLKILIIKYKHKFDTNSKTKTK